RSASAIATQRSYARPGGSSSPRLGKLAGNGKGAHASANRSPAALATRVNVGYCFGGPASNGDGNSIVNGCPCGPLFEWRSQPAAAQSSATAAASVASHTSRAGLRTLAQ